MDQEEVEALPMKSFFIGSHEGSPILGLESPGESPRFWTVRSRQDLRAIVFRLQELLKDPDWGEDDILRFDGYGDPGQN